MNSLQIPNLIIIGQGLSGLKFGIRMVFLMLKQDWSCGFPWLGVILAHAPTIADKSHCFKPYLVPC
jgi:hypothetical protein